MSKARALVVTRNLPPLQGGMERLNWHLIDELASQYDVTVCGPRGCRAYLPPNVVVHESPLRPLLIFLIFNFIQTFVITLFRRPALVLAGSGLTGPTAWISARIVGASAIGYLHGLDIVADHPIYQAVWLPLLRRLDFLFVNSQYTKQLAVAAGLNVRRIHLLHPGVAIPEIASDNGIDFRHRFGFNDQPLILSLGRLTNRKGLSEFVENALPILVQQHPRLVLAIIGDDAVDALSGRANQRERIASAARGLGLADHVRLLGIQSDAVVVSAFAASQALVFPVLDLPNDVEGFGMVAVEAAAYGVPTVSFAVGGIADAVADGVSGRLVKPGDYQAFADAVGDVLAKSENPDVRRLCRNHAVTFRWEAFGMRLRQICAAIREVGGRENSNMANPH